MKKIICKLHLPKIGIDFIYFHFKSGAWCTNRFLEERSDNLQWLELKFDTPMKATAILTKGLEVADYLTWVETYQISYSINGDSWSLYKDKDGRDKVRKVK